MRLPDFFSKRKVPLRATPRLPTGAAPVRDTPLAVYADDMLMPRIREPIIRAPERFLGVFVLVLGLGLFLAVRWGSPYTAEARLLIMPSDTVPPQGQDGSPAPPVPSLPQGGRDADREIELLGSMGLHQNTIDRMGLKTLYPDIWRKLEEQELPLWLRWGSRLMKGLLFDDGQANTEKLLLKRREWLFGAALQRFHGALNISRTSAPDLLAISFKHANPAIALAALQAYIQAYEQTRDALFSQGLSDDSNRLRMNHYGDLQHTLEERIAELKRKNNISSLAEQKSMLVSRGESLRDSLMANRTALEVMNARLESLQKQLATAPAATGGPALAATPASQEAIGKMTETLVELERQKKMLSQGPNGQGAQLRDVNEKIQALKSFLGKRRNPVPGDQANGRESPRQHLELEMAKGITEVVALQRRLELEQADEAAIGETLKTYAGLENELNELQRQRDLALEHYRLHARTAEEARLHDQALRQSMNNVRVLQPPLHATQDLTGAMLIWLSSIPLGLLLALLADRLD